MELDLLSFFSLLVPDGHMSTDNEVIRVKPMAWIPMD